MILIAVHVNNPKDIPAKIEMQFADQASCERSRQSMSYWVKFEDFRIESKCVKKL